MPYHVYWITIVLVDNYAQDNTSFHTNLFEKPPSLRWQLGNMPVKSGLAAESFCISNSGLNFNETRHISDQRNMSPDSNMLCKRCIFLPVAWCARWQARSSNCCYSYALPRSCIEAPPCSWFMKGYFKSVINHSASQTLDNLPLFFNLARRH